MPGNWDFAELDAEIAADLKGFLPPQLFDAHAHLYRIEDLPEVPPLMQEGPGDATPDTWRTHLGRQVGEERITGALFMPFPLPGADVAALNRRLMEDLERAPESRGAVLIPPDGGPEALQEPLEHPRAVGLKPYHSLIARESTFEAALGEYLPPWAWQLADERGLVIVLHLVRHGALSDPSNQEQLLAMCRQLPGARVLLAHAARGFHAPNTVRGVEAIASLENVWFDSSGICEAAPLVAVLQTFGPERLLWGSDFPVTQIRGRCVTVGDGFAWLDQTSVDWSVLKPPCRPTLVGLESLRALREAVQITGLSSSQVQDIFHGNARRLFELP
ncbi:MAG: amidohydrolase family protein [Armatimonadota bacterium]|nr:amidohydrolase family protein [Armatimonadota bacterium]